MSDRAGKTSRHSRLPWIVRLLLSLSIRNEAVREALLGDLEQEFAGIPGPRTARLVRWIRCCGAGLALASRFTLNRASALYQPFTGQTFSRSIRRSPWLSPKAERLGDAWKDVRFAFRGLTKSKGFTFITVFSLALGIGVNTALFSFTSAFLDPVSGVTGADRIVEVLSSYRGQEAQEWTYLDFEDVRTADTPIAELAGSKQREASILINGVGQSVQVVYVTANYFRVLGVGMFLGRDFFPSEDVGPGLNPIAILSYDRWQTDLGGDPAIIGQTITLNRTPYTVVGIASREFRGHQSHKMGPYQPDLWVPLTQHPFVASSRSFVDDRRARWLEVLGKLRSNVTVDETNVALHAIFNRLAEEYPETNEGRSARAATFGPLPALNRTLSLASVAMTFTLSGLALMIICGNLAGMGLARSASKEREIAVRLALGSGRGRLVRFLMVEAILLALIGGAVGVLLVFWGTSAPLLRRFGIVLPPHFDISPDGTVLAVSIVLAMATTLVFGLFPAIRFSRPELVSSLKDDAGGGGRRVGRIHRIAASAQTGLALALLIVCSLFVRALSLMESRDLGFEPNGLLMARVDLSRDGNESLEDGEAFLNRVRESVGSIPGVTSVAFADGIPLDLSGNFSRVTRADRTDEAAGRVTVEFTRVTEGFFETIGTPILQGRGFEPTDVASSEPVAVITTSLAERLWPGEDGLGRQIRFSISMEDSARVFTVVGIVGHTASSRPTEDWPHLFAALRQNYRPRIMIAARASMDALTLVAPIRSAILDADPNLPIPNVQTSESLVARSTSAQRVNAQAAAGFGLLALLLSAIGVYGVVAFSVASRTREIGLRMAMGATRRRVLFDVFRDAVRLALPGLILGTLVAVGTAVAMGSFLLGLSPVDPYSLGFAVGVLFLVVLLASLIPARKASGIDPMNALRCE